MKSTLYCCLLLLLVACSSKEDEPTPVEPEIIPPKLNALSPSSGTTGTVVKLMGTNFATALGNNTVHFGDKTASITSGSQTELYITVPSGFSAGSVSIKVVAKNLESNVLPFTIASPALSSSIPTVGLTGTIVHLKGEYFSSLKTENSVLFNDKVATISSSSSTDIFVNVPEGLSPGDVNIKIGVNSSFSNTIPFTIVEPATYAIGFIGGSDSPGGPQLSRFNLPTSLATGPDGNIYVADRNNDLIRMIDKDNLIQSVAGGVQGYQDGNVVSAKFYFPTGIAVDHIGNIFIGEEGNLRVRKIDPNGNVTTLAGNGGVNLNDGVGTNAGFGQPSGLAVNANGDLYIADRGTARIRKVTSDGTVTTVAGSSGNFGFADGNGVNAKFNYPSGIASDIHGNLYVADEQNNRIRKIDPSGNVTTVAGNGNAGYVDGPASTAEFNGPWGIAVDSYGNIFVADEYNNVLRKIDPSGTVSTIGTFTAPLGVCIDSDGNIFVSDSHHVIKLTAQ
jgi:sugar lactone lactonase YvrE